MARNSDAYSLIESFRDIGYEQAKEMYRLTDEVETALDLGMSSIGHLMFVAAESEEYEGEEISQDMSNLGMLFKHLTRIKQGISLAKENCSFTIRQAEGGMSK